MKRILSTVVAGVVAGVFAFTGLVPASAAPGTQALHITKNCKDYHGGAGEFCTITTSNLRLIKPGSRVIYKSAAGLTSLDSDIVLRTGHGNRAFGHVVLDFVTATGTVRLNGGTGRFRHFHARVAVSYIGGPDGFDWAWDGTYHFSCRH
jgi:hypothetical protein